MGVVGVGLNSAVGHRVWEVVGSVVECAIMCVCVCGECDYEY